MANMQFMGVVRAQASGLGLAKHLIMQPNVESIETGSELWDASEVFIVFGSRAWN